MCPANRIGTVDVFQVSIHGQDKGVSPALAQAIGARVAIMGNGPRKVGPGHLARSRNAPGMQDIWQVHYSELGTWPRPIRLPISSPIPKPPARRNGSSYRPSPTDLSLFHQQPERVFQEIPAALTAATARPVRAAGSASVSALPPATAPTALPKIILYAAQK